MPIVEIRLLVGAVVALTITCASAARADELRAHATAGIAHAVVEPQEREFGWGGAGSASLELPLSRAFGIEGKASGLVLSQGDPPADVSLARQGTGTAFLFTGGVRIRPFTRVAGPWMSIGAGLAQTGDRSRLGFDAALGWDFRLSRASRWDLGPYVGANQILQPNDSIRPDDARVISFGIHIGLGVADKPPPREEAPPPRGDRDGDGVFDDEDACPDVAGIRTDDPKTNGCPRSDRDGDGVFDDEDACPDVAGVRTDDPKTNGCPRSDRDGDGVFDDEDACPDLPGVRSEDPRANGCPPAAESVRVEKDRILLDDVIIFDLDSPRVRSASWGIIKKLAEFMNDNPNILEISIEGHADATGTEQHNMVLSRERAESVRRLLVKYGVDAERIKAEAFGRSRLKVETSRAEAANRRVEFWVTRTRPAGGH